MVRQSEELVLKKEMLGLSSDIPYEISKINRSHSLDHNTFVEAQPILTTGWFDNDDDFEAHRR